MITHRYGAITIETSKEDKVFFPDAEITKGDLIDYYDRIADHMLPLMKNRPVMMHRFPDGIKGKNFYHKNVPDYFPNWIDTVLVKKEDGTVTHVVCNKQATLVYLADQACITPHIWLSRSDRIHNPDRMIFDLDPPEDNFGPVQDAAFMVHDLLDVMDLDSFPMTTGSRGLHVIVPLNREADFDTVCAFAQQAAEFLAGQHPDELTVEPRKNKRGSRLFLDTARNDYGQTAVAPYSVRAVKNAPLATPLDWFELKKSELTARTYTMNNIFRRLSQKDDPWQGLNRRGKSLTRARKKLKELRS